MTRKSFRNQRIHDYGGGLNLRESPNQIEDKQSQVCENWNFEGNRLVNSKRMKQLYNLWGTTQVQGIKEFEWDVYFVHDSKLYKNWVEIVFTGTLPDKKVHISIWWDLYFFTFEDGTEPPYYINAWVLSSVAGIGFPRYNVVYNGKWILGGYDNDNIYFSQTAGPTNPTDIFDFASYSAGSQSVGGNSTWRITGFSIWENWLYVFKYDEVLYSNTEKDSGSDFNFVFNPVSTTWTLNQNLITPVQQDIFYFDSKNNAVRRLSYEHNLTTLRDTAISDEITPLLERLTESQYNATGSYLYPNYKLFLRSNFAGTDYNEITLVYNVDNKSWWTETGKACFVSHNGYLWSTFEWKIWKDDQLPWKKWVRISKQWDFWDWIDNKRYWELEIKGRMESTLTLYVDIYVNWLLEETRTINVSEQVSSTFGTITLWTGVLWSPTTSNQMVDFRERFDLWLEGQYIEIWLRYEWLGNVEVSEDNIQWKLIKWYKLYA